MRNVFFAEARGKGDGLMELVLDERKCIQTSQRCFSF